MRFTLTFGSIIPLAYAALTRDIVVGIIEGTCPPSCPSTNITNFEASLAECLTGITNGSYPNCTYTAKVTINGSENVKLVCSGITNAEMPIGIYTLPALVDVNNASLGQMVNSEVEVGFDGATVGCEYKFYNSTATGIPSEETCTQDQNEATATEQTAFTVAAQATSAKLDVSTLVDKNKMTLAYKYLIGNNKDCPVIKTVKYTDTSYEFAVAYVTSGTPHVITSAGILLLAQQLLL